MQDDEAMARALQESLNSHSSAGAPDSTSEADLALACRLQDEDIRQSARPHNGPVPDTPGKRHLYRGSKSGWGFCMIMSILLDAMAWCGNRQNRT